MVLPLGLGSSLGGHSRATPDSHNLVLAGTVQSFWPTLSSTGHPASACQHAADPSRIAALSHIVEVSMPAAAEPELWGFDAGP